MDWLTFLIYGLATYRAALMVATEEGPFEVFTWLRGKLDPNELTWLGRGMNCPYCISFWAGLALAGLYCLGLGWLIFYPVIGLGLSGLTVFLIKLTDND